MTIDPERQQLYKVPAPSLLYQITTHYERYHIAVALASLAFLAQHSEALLPSTIDRIKSIGEPSRRLHGALHPQFTDDDS